MSETWVLSLEAGVSPDRRVAGLALALRLALNAQAAGARGIVAGDAAIGAVLTRDPKLVAPVLEAAPADVRVIALPAHAVVHRDYFRSVLERAQAGGEPERPLSEAPFGFAESGPYRFEPIEVVDGKSAREAERRLFRALRKPEDGWTSRHLNRYLSLGLSRWLVRTPLTPNTVSLGILAIGLCGAWLASRGGFQHLLAGACLFQAQSVLDGCDGEMSRVTYRTSLRGQWLDTVGDDLTNYGFFLGAGWGLFQTTGSSFYALVAASGVTAGAIASGLEYRYLVKIGSGDLLSYPLSRSGPSSRIGRALAPLFKRDTFVLLTLVAAAAGQIGVMLVLFSFGALVVLASVVRTELQMAEERARS